jgi:hypothetical protein
MAVPKRLILDSLGETCEQLFCELAPLSSSPGRRCSVCSSLWRAGEEVVGVLAPVSLCMAVTVCLVRILNPDGHPDVHSAVKFASLAYDESSHVSSAMKLSKREDHPARSMPLTNMPVLCMVAGWGLRHPEVQRGAAQCAGVRGLHGGPDICAGAPLQV